MEGARAYRLFCNCQLAAELNSEDEGYIKRKCRTRINMAGHYLLLIGADTRSKHKYVRWEAKVAVEKGCTIIDVNLDKTRFINQDRTPTVIQNIGALFFTFSPPIIAHALKNYKMMDSKNYHYPDAVYQQLGYIGWVTHMRASGALGQAGVTPRSYAQSTCSRSCG
jgi:hypothetical protein